MKTFTGIAMLLFVLGLTWGVTEVIESSQEPYFKVCRAAGGVPVHTDGVKLNCARPEGGWIDVRP